MIISPLQIEAREAIGAIETIETEEEERLIRQSKIEWRETVDTIRDLIIVENIDGTIRRCNKVVCKFFNLKFQELIGSPLLELFKNHLQIPTNFVEAFWPNGIFRVGACQVQNIEGNKWYEINNNSIVHGGFKKTAVNGWVHVIKDITAHKTAEMVMKHLGAAIEQTDDSVLITNINGHIEYTNPSFENLTSWEFEEVKGLHFLCLLAPSSGAAKFEALNQAIELEQVWRGICVLLRKDGSTYQAEMTVSPVRNEKNDLLNFVVVGRDVTEKSRLESIAEAVNAMDNVGYIFSGIRHELGNPINSIKTALTVLRSDIDALPAARIAEFIDRTLIEVGRVEYLLKSLKTFSMHENPNIQSTSLVTFFEKFLSLIKNDFIKQGIFISHFIEIPIANCLVDQRALHQILINLITNAADALKEQTDPIINIVVYQSGSQITVKVKDNGCGMSDKQIGNLFKPFYTSKPHGTGLGLVIVKRMITKMKGTIDVKSLLGIGTEVTLSLEASLSD